MTLKELEKFLKLCRKQGVQSIKFEGTEVHLGDLPLVTSSKTRPLRPSTKNPSLIVETFTPGGVTEDSQIQVDTLTPEQLLFYSSDPFSGAETQ